MQRSTNIFVSDVNDFVQNDKFEMIWLWLKQREGLFLLPGIILPCKHGHLSWWGFKFWFAVHEFCVLLYPSGFQAAGAVTELWFESLQS